MKKFSKKLKKGFTLVELVVVIAIIAILSAASVATYFGVTTSARKSTSKSNAQQVAQLIYVEALSELDDSPINFGTAGLVLTYTVGESNGGYANDNAFLAAYLAENGITVDEKHELTSAKSEVEGHTNEVASLTYTESGYSYTISFANRNYTLTAAN
mgnify:FL=1